MSKFEVTVEKTQYLSGTITVTAKDSDAALKQVQDKIYSGELQTTMVEWGDPEYQDGTFHTTGDVS
jgi:hypothetical protein